jgi:hypothetical protein
MMSEQWIVLIRENEAANDALTAEQIDARDKAHTAFVKAVEDAGAKMLAGAPLKTTDTAVSITPARNGAPAVFTDGPFTEVKEVVSGYYKLEVKDAAQARELAARVPTIGHNELYALLPMGMSA